MIAGLSLPVRRIYVFHTLAFAAGVILLALAAPSKPSASGPMQLESVARWVALSIGQFNGDWARAQREMSQVEAHLAIAVTVFGPDGRRVLDTDAGRTGPITRAEQDRLRDDEVEVFPQGKVAFALGGMPGYYGLLKVRWPPPRAPRSPLLAALVLLFAILAASFAFNRSLVQPMRRLVAAAAAFGAGDLRARADLNHTDELGELASAFDHMAEQIERLVRNQKEMLANISHELRTPLARIQVGMELASEGDQAMAREALLDIREDVDELRGLLEDVLASARLDLAMGRAGKGGPPHHLEPLDPRGLLQQAVQRLGRAAPDRVLHVDIAADLPNQIEADGTLLRRAVDNLLDNARKYADGPISLAASVDGSDLKIEVRDEGPGMSAEQVEMIFTPFYRAQPDRGPGLGLGLTLVQRIAEAHGGTIEARSALGEGSCFTLRVPAGLA